MEYFIEYLERKIEACDELGELQREKAVYQSTLKEYRKAIYGTRFCMSEAEQLFCSCGSRKVKTTGGSQCTNNRCSL